MSPRATFAAPSKRASSSLLTSFSHNISSLCSNWAVIVFPLAPHLSLERAIVLSKGSMVRIKVRTDHTAILTVDGQSEVELASGDWVQVTASPRTGRFIRMQDRAYFYRTLIQRLGLPISEPEDL